MAGSGSTEEERQNRNTYNTEHIFTRWAIRRDIPEILAIEGENSDFPMSEDDFIRFIRQRNSLIMVAQYMSLVVGFAFYELGEKNIRILKLEVRSNLEPVGGIAKALIDRIKTRLNERRNTIIMDRVVRGSKLQEFLQEQNFTEATPFFEMEFRLKEGLQEPEMESGVEPGQKK